MKRASLCVITLCAFAASATFAGEEPTGPWSGTAGLGFLTSTGNTENSTFNGTADVAYEYGRWHHGARALAIGTSSNKDTTAERYELGFKSDYDLSAVSYVFGLIDFEKDRFSGYDQRIWEGVGYGRRLREDDIVVWNAEGAIGAQQADLNLPTGGTMAENNVFVRVGTDVAWKFSPTADLTQLLQADWTSDNTLLTSVTAINAALRDDIGLSLSYTIKHNTDVISPLDETDTYTAINLTYAF